MHRQARWIIGAVCLLASFARGSPLAASISPALPTTADTVWVLISASIGGADTVVDSGIAIAGAAVDAYISIRPCRGVCPRSIKMVNLRLRAGMLAAGSYNLAATINRIDRSQAPPDTTRSVTARTFYVYRAATSPHRLVGVYQSDHGKTSPDTASYYFTNGDTLSVTAVFPDQCCARYAGAMHSTGDGVGDTVTVLFTDTTMLMCNCAGTQYVTAAIDNVSSARVWIRLLYANAWSAAPQLLYAFAADRSAPAVCINLTELHSPGFKLYVDSSWFQYELPSTVVNRVSMLRLQPNPGFEARTNNSLFIDNIGIDTAAFGGVWTGSGAVLESFESYYEGQWQLIAHRDGSALTQYWLLTSVGHLTELEYSNRISGSVSNYVWRSLNPQRTINSASRIIITASCARPEGATAAADWAAARRIGKADGLRIAADEALLGISIDKAACRGPARVEAVGIDGRIRAAVIGMQRTIVLRHLQPGVYLVRIRAAGESVSRAKLAIVP